MFLNDQRATDKIREETLKFLGSNENENTEELRGIAISKRKLKAIVLKLKPNSKIIDGKTIMNLQRTKDTKSSLFKNIKQTIKLTTDGE